MKRILFTILFCLIYAQAFCAVSLLQHTPHYQGDSLDEKPTDNVLIGSIYYETDSTLSYTWNGYTWLLGSAGQTQANVNHPLSVDGDTVYEKDINKDESDSGTFTGNVYDLYNTYSTDDVLVDSSATNPKTFTLFFIRPVTTNEIGLASAGGNFSNVKIDLQSASGNWRNGVDFSADDTDRSDFLYRFTKTTFIKAVISFHTADPVSLNGSKIKKIQARSISAIDGYVSETNTTLSPLLADAVFTGGQVDTLNYGVAQLSIFSDKPSAALGLKFQFRSTPTSTWYDGNSYTYEALSDKPYSEQVSRRFMRVIYTNGDTDQTVFDMQVMLKPVYVKPSSHEVGKTISNQDDAELVKAVITGENPAGDFVKSFRFWLCEIMQQSGKP